MKMLAGLYKIPDMMPSNLFLPGGYKFTNTGDKIIFLELSSSPKKKEYYYRDGLRENESIVVFLEEGTYLKLEGPVEVEPYNPEA